MCVLQLRKCGIYYKSLMKELKMLTMQRKIFS